MLITLVSIDTSWGPWQIRARSFYSRIAKTYDHPKTPCDRILARDQVSEETKQLLRAKQEALDPMKLSAVIETKLQAIQALIEEIEEPEPKRKKSGGRRRG